MDSDGSNQINLTNHAAVDMHPTWHSNGKTILFNSNREDTTGMAIYTMDLSTQKIKRLTDSKMTQTYAWYSPDGKKILFVNWLPIAGSDQLDREIFVMSQDGTNPVNLTNNPGSLLAELDS